LGKLASSEKLKIRIRKFLFGTPFDTKFTGKGKNPYLAT
jgi:hypothetical protein